MTQIEELELILDTLVRLVESTKGTVYTKENAWIKDTQPIAAKLFMHSGSLYHLLQGTKVNNILEQDIVFVDHHSIIVLVRAIHELYLAFNYLYVAPSSDAIRAFRHHIWALGAFLDRQRFPTTIQENIEKKEKEKSIVAELTEKIISHTEFASLSESEKDRALKGEWRLNYGWVDLADFAHLDKEQFRFVYRYLCSYAHTGHLSIFQMQPSSESSFPLGKVWIDSALGVISHFIYDYIKIYPQSEAILKANPLAEQQIYIRDGLGRNNNKGG